MNEVEKSMNIDNMKLDVQKTINCQFVTVHRQHSFVDENKLYLKKYPFWIKSWNYNSTNPHPCWKNFPLILNEHKYESNLKLVPNIKNYLEHTGPYKVAGLSWLPPNCSIPYHKDNKYFTEVCHLVLLGNKDSYLTVEDKKFKLDEPGKKICFDDSKLHKSCNDSKSEDRITLYLKK